MDSSAELESCSNELAIAVKSLVAYFRTNKGVQNGSYMPFIDPEASPEVQKAKQSVLSNVAKIRMLVYAPADFLKHLASQVRLPFVHSSTDIDINTMVAYQSMTVYLGRNPGVPSMAWGVPDPCLHSADRERSHHGYCESLGG